MSYPAEHVWLTGQTTMLFLSLAGYIAGLVTMVVTVHYYVGVRYGIACLAIIGLVTLADVKNQYKK